MNRRELERVVGSLQPLLCLRPAPKTKRDVVFDWCLMNALKRVMLLLLLLL